MKSLVDVRLFVSLFSFAWQTDEMIITPAITLSDGSRLVGKVFNDSLFQTWDYMAIPYAQAPVRELRFMDPVKKEPWGRKVFRAVKMPYMCPNIIPKEFRNGTLDEKIYSEDCLTLNVITPQNCTSSENDEENLPVMVWIHGGSFKRGSSTRYSAGGRTDLHGRSLVTWGGVVFVSLNYRLGPLGFLYAGNSLAPGNMGLKDQLLALQWVRDNIKMFCGSPNKVTLFGDEAGAASISLHMIMRQDSSLFQKAILQSGTALSPWATNDKAYMLAQTRVLASELACDLAGTTDYVNMVRCLRQRNVIDLSYALWPAYKLSEFMNHRWVPVIDGQFLKRHPSEGFESRDTKPLHALMLGNVLNECLSLFISYKHEMRKYDAQPPNASWIDFSIPAKFNTTLLRRIIQQEYNKDHLPCMAGKCCQALFEEQMCSDVQFIAGTEQLAQLYTDNYDRKNFMHYDSPNMYTPRPNVYRYVLGHGQHDPDSLVRTAFLQDDLKLLFGEPFQPDSLVGSSEKTKALSRRMVRYWTNFAKTGDPNIHDGIARTWNPYDSTRKSYMFLDSDLNDHPEEKFRDRHCSFWNEHLPKLAELTGQCPILN